LPEQGCLLSHSFFQDWQYFFCHPNLTPGKKYGDNKDNNLPGPAQRGSYEPRQIRKKAAAVANPCAAGSLAF